MLTLFLLGILVAVILLAVHQVPTRLTKEDEAYIGRILAEGGLPALGAEREYEEERLFILKVQELVQRVAGKKVDGRLVEIPMDHTREPRDLYEARSGGCFDTSRTLEKIFKANGFKTRHVFIFSTPDANAFLRTALSPKASDSHAATEVLTRKGWLVVDPIHRWISIDENCGPVSLRMIHQDLPDRRIQWHPDYHPRIERSYNENFIYVYGLYSRHGRFYPPYNRMPDINWRELLAHVDWD